ncbi:MAG TPA: fumarylacetoacetate hydrolase family protein [Terriglobales bacterium]|jgi:2-keto-4-pentenoate hydratase/2-oxohepta-3-ene-1,7-dioic acid hydratase in catechol pathway
MPWVRFLQQGQICWGRLESDHIQVYSGTPLGEHNACRPQPGVERLPREAVDLLAPCTPSKIVCIGRNYREHARELGNDVPAEPLIFLKPPSALLPPGGTIVLPRLSQQVEYEGELGVVIGRRCRNLALEADPREYVLGFTCVNDVTARDLQKKDSQWARAKGFDTFCPIGPCVVETPQAGERPWEGLTIETRVNGEVRQQGNTADFIFPLPRLLQAITAVMTLEPGDVIATGTPAGVGRLNPGDRVSVTIAGVGTLENLVAAAE